MTEQKAAKVYRTLTAYDEDVETINKIKGWLFCFGYTNDSTHPETIKFLVDLFKGKYPDALKETKP